MTTKQSEVLLGNGIVFDLGFFNLLQFTFRKVGAHEVLDVRRRSDTSSLYTYGVYS
jgi:hypothetical protein